MKNIAALLGLALLGACSSDNKSGTAADAKTITFNDFEAVAGWSIDPGLLDKGRAHSGQYAIKVDKDHEFSLTFDLPLGQVSPRKFRIVHLEAWAFRASEKATGFLGVQVVEPSTGQQVFLDGIKLLDADKTPNKWVAVSKDIALPDNITSAQHLRFALWRAGSEDTVLLDDVKLSIKD